MVWSNDLTDVNHFWFVSFDYWLVDYTGIATLNTKYKNQFQCTHLLLLKVDKLCSFVKYQIICFYNWSLYKYYIAFFADPHISGSVQKADLCATSSKINCIIVVIGNLMNLLMDLCDPKHEMKIFLLKFWLNVFAKKMKNCISYLVCVWHKHCFKSHYNEIKIFNLIKIRNTSSYHVM